MSRGEAGGPPHAIVLNPPDSFPILEVAALIVITAVLDYLFYMGAGGISCAIAIVIVPAAVYLIAPPKVLGRHLLVFALLFAAFAFKYAWQIDFLAVVVGMWVLVSYAIALRTGHADIFLTGICLLPTCMIGGVRWVENTMALLKTEKRGLSEERRQELLKIVGIPLAVTAAFAIVFLLSNPLVRSFATRALRACFDRASELWLYISPDPIRAGFWMVSLWLLAALVRPLTSRFTWDKAWLSDGEIPLAIRHVKPALTYAIAFNTLLGVNVLFLLYNAFDAYYLVVCAALPPGLNHSQYAHQGAQWLTVALAMSTVVLGVIFSGRLREHPKAKRLLVLAVPWIAQNFVVAYWVLARLHLYVGYNGLTRMRIVGIYGTVAVIAGLTLVAWKIRRGHSLFWLLRRQLAALALTLALLGITPLDLMTWHVNTRLIATMEIPKPAVQLVVQPISPEGLMLLPPLLDHGDPAIARGVAALLGRWYCADDAPNRRWTQRQLSRDLCMSTIARYEDKILSLIPDRRWEPHLKELRRRTQRWI